MFVVNTKAEATPQTNPHTLYCQLQVTHLFRHHHAVVVGIQWMFKNTTKMIVKTIAMINVFTLHLKRDEGPNPLADHFTGYPKSVITEK